MTSSSLPTTRFNQLKSLRALAFGLTLGFAAPVFADDLPEVQRLIKQAQYPQALEKVDSYLSNKPKDAQGRFLKGLIFTEMNKQADAIAVFTKLTEDYPELPEPYNNLAVLYAQQKQYDKARTALEMAIRTHPSYAIAYEIWVTFMQNWPAKLTTRLYNWIPQTPTTQNKLALIRDLISTSSKPNVKPQMPATASAPASQPAAIAPPLVTQAGKTTTPTATVVNSVAGAASTTQGKAAETKSAASAQPTDEVAKTLAAWANAWSRKDVKGYIAQYSADFNPPKGMSRKEWEAERAKRIAGKSGNISVSYDEPKISINGDKATAKFRQHYKAAGIKSSTSKTLVFVHSGNRWLIQEENAR